MLSYVSISGLSLNIEEWLQIYVNGWHYTKEYRIKQGRAQGKRKSKKPKLPHYDI